MNDNQPIDIKTITDRELQSLFDTLCLQREIHSNQITQITGELLTRQKAAYEAAQEGEHHLANMGYGERPRLMLPKLKKANPSGALQQETGSFTV